MPYDFEDENDKSPPTLPNVTVSSDSHEAHRTLLELAAIYLTPENSSTFTVDALLAEVRVIAEPEFIIDEQVAMNIINECKFLIRNDDGTLRLN